MVQVVVGTGASAKTFNVYKDLLTFYSDYFRTALKNCWMEGRLKQRQTQQRRGDPA
jgi:hypothetical protein